MKSTQEKGNGAKPDYLDFVPQLTKPMKKPQGSDYGDLPSADALSEKLKEQKKDYQSLPTIDKSKRKPKEIDEEEECDLPIVSVGSPSQRSSTPPPSPKRQPSSSNLPGGLIKKQTTHDYAELPSTNHSPPTSSPSKMSVFDPFGGSAPNSPTLKHANMNSIAGTKVREKGGVRRDESPDLNISIKANNEKHDGHNNSDYTGLPVQYNGKTKAVDTQSSSSGNDYADLPVVEARKK